MRRFATQLCRFLGIDEAEGVRLLVDRRHNIRLSQVVVDRMVGFGDRGVVSVIHAASGRALRKRILRVDGLDDSLSARLPISAAVREAIEEKTREGDRKTRRCR